MNKQQIEDYPELKRRIDQDAGEIDSFGLGSGLGGMIEVVSKSDVQKLALSMQSKIDSLTEQNKEFQQMLSHLIIHDCINDHSLVRECETLINKESK